MSVVKDKEYFMREAIKEAKKAGAKNEVPVGAVLVVDNKIIARAHNQRNTKCDPSAHAEILCMRKAGAKLGAWNLSGAELYVTLEPCLMCAGAIVYARIAKVYYGASDIRFGCLGTIENFAQDARFNHRAEVETGILAEECLTLIQEFFREQRKVKKDTKK